MKKFFDKSKCYNYIIAGIFLIASVMFIKSMAFNIWNFNLFNKRQLIVFLKNIASGKVLFSGKQFSFLITFVGASCVVFGGMLISMQLNLSKKISEKVEEKVEEKVDTPVENTTENAPVPEKIPEKAQEIIPTNDKFAMYDNVNKIQQVLDNSREIPQVQDVVNKIPTQNEDEERSKLQSKIKEIIKKMQNKSENNVVEEKKPSKNLL